MSSLHIFCLPQPILTAPFASFVRPAFAACILAVYELPNSPQSTFSTLNHTVASAELAQRTFQVRLLPRTAQWHSSEWFSLAEGDM